MDETLILWILSAALIGSGLLLYVQWRAARRDRTEAEARREEGQQREEAYRIQVHELEKTVLLLESRLAQEEEKVKEKQDQYARWGQEVEDKFQHLATRILDQSSERFSLRQETEMKRVLEPLKSDIRQFKDELAQKTRLETRDRMAIQEQVRLMMELNQTLSEQANSLTRAIRGEFRTQGSWGEVVLLGILEQIGLQKDVHYFPQVTAQNADGRRIRPDVLIQLPENRQIIIDSKVSLVAYERYAQAEGEEKAREVQNLLRSMKTHVDELSSRSYGDMDEAMDFVLLFVPVEAAYMLAMKEEPGLWQYAYSRKVLLVSPTSLVATLRLVHSLWQKEALYREADKIGQRVAALYDKLVGFVDNMEKVGQQLDRARDTWDDAYKQLYTGRGNIIRRAEQITRSSTNKSLPDHLVRRARDNDPDEEEDEPEEESGEQ